MKYEEVKPLLETAIAQGDGGLQQRLYLLGLHSST
jgi:hypothetical protein